MEPLAARYVCAAGLLVRHWPGESTAAVFSAETVSTHLVNEWAGAVLEIAASRPVSASDLVSLLALSAGPLDSEAVDTGEDLHQVEETITGLLAAGLLRRVA